MRSGVKKVLAVLLILGGIGAAIPGQVFSPRVFREGQPDATDLAGLAAGIFRQAGAVTPRQKAEAIWCFFLTDGRFVPPGMWYHIAGWAYEEPQGEVLDPLKLLHSYGFGLCYQLAPLLEAVFRAGGFEDARTWFLTGHTVAEVFYEGAYHHFDADMMGYTTTGRGDPRTAPVASVAELAADGSLFLSRLLSPREADASRVAFPWYPADVAAAAIPDLAALFTTRADNWLFAEARSPQGHSMDFVLRPGERLIRYFQPESSDCFYLPFRYDGRQWQEFPREVAAYGIRTEDGPRSQKDARLWATGKIEYRPVLSDRRGLNFAVFEMRSPYVLIDARLSFQASLPQKGQALEASLSVDGGRSWERMGERQGPFRGEWQVRPAVLSAGPHGGRSAVSGRYQYLVRIAMSGSRPGAEIGLRDLRIESRLQLNPRTLPALGPGPNRLQFEPGAAVERKTIPVETATLCHFAKKALHIQSREEGGQIVLYPEEGKTAEILLELTAPDSLPLAGFDAGARFLDLREGWAPDKCTAEIRKTRIGQGNASREAPRASIAWSASADGEYTPLWEFPPQPAWKDGQPVRQQLRWPEVDRQVRSLPSGTRTVYLRYRLKGMGLDSPRLAVLCAPPRKPSRLEITHRWDAEGKSFSRTETVLRPDQPYSYQVDTGAARPVVNRAIVLYCPPE